mgnify:CR=1 FL=1
MTDHATLYYAHDPMCSWCWAFAPRWLALRLALESEVADKLSVCRLLGGLAPDSDVPMPEPMQNYLKQTWSTIQQRVPGTRFNFDFWTHCSPRRSTWPACRAVIAARKQGIQYDESMTGAIQLAYYLEARNPSDEETLVILAEENGLDKIRFADDLNSEETRNEHQREMNTVQRLGVRGFPALVLLGNGWGQSIGVDYADTQTMLGQIHSLLEKGNAQDQ